MESGFMTIVSFLVLLLEAVGVAVIVGGFVVSTIVYIAQPPLWATHAAYQAYRRRSVRGLILGLEFLVAADIIKTVAIDYTLESVMLLGVIILIRSFLVFALHFEIDGRFPWSRGDSSE